MVNRLAVINHQIPFEWLSLMYTTYKIRCKEKQENAINTAHEEGTK